MEAPILPDRIDVTGRWRGGVDLRRRVPWRVLVALGVGGAGFLLLRMGGTLTATTDALVEMGFDPDRARLIAALTGAAIAGSAAGLVTGHRLAAGIVSMLSFAALFQRTFLDETQAALAAHAEQGVFDPAGWVFTVATLAMAGLVVAWAAATLAADARRGLIAAGAVAAKAVRRRTVRGLPAWKPGLAVLVVALLAVTAPTFGDMVNYTPDLLMRQGGPAAIPLVPATSQDGTASASASASAAPLPSALVPNPQNGTLATSGAVSDQRPWLVHAPSGQGRIQAISFPAPWTGGRTTTASAWIYLPPGYSTATTRYSTIYEVPWTLYYWNQGSEIVTQLDALIASGQIPPTIVVFITADGGPFVDSECADSADGREHFDTYVADTVVPYVDAHYRTIKEAAARTVLGYSQGGYCSATLVLHHPDIFGNAIAMSGYYTAAPSDPQTINAWRPFDQNQALIRADSPLLIAPTLPADVRSSLFLILTGSPTERFYGPNFRQFATVLTADHYAVVVLPTQLGHAWKGVRSMLPTVLSALAGHELQAGVFKGIYT